MIVVIITVRVPASMALYCIAEYSGSVVASDCGSGLASACRDQLTSPDLLPCAREQCSAGVAKASAFHEPAHSCRAIPIASYPSMDLL
jgi:hypothetical protein